MEKKENLRKIIKLQKKVTDFMNNGMCEECQRRLKELKEQV